MLRTHSQTSGWSLTEQVLLSSAVQCGIVSNYAVCAVWALTGFPISLHNRQLSRLSTPAHKRPTYPNENRVLMFIFP